MNKVIVIYIKGKEYNHMFKWNSIREFSEALYNNDNLPNKEDIVTEAYIDDNLVDVGNTFEVTLNKLKLILDI